MKRLLFVAALPMLAMPAMAECSNDDPLQDRIRPTVHLTLTPLQLGYADRGNIPGHALLPAIGVSVFAMRYCDKTVGMGLTVAYASVASRDESVLSVSIQPFAFRVVDRVYIGPSIGYATGKCRNPAGCISGNMPGFMTFGLQANICAFGCGRTSR